MKKATLGLVVSLLLSTSAVLADGGESRLDYKSFYDCDGEDKFLWYCEEKEKIKKLKPKPKESETKPEEPKEELLTEREQKLAKFQFMKKELLERLHIAYVEPTEENLKAYIEYQNMVMNQAAVFTDVWKRTQWKNAELDYSVTNPMSSMGKKARMAKLRETEDMNTQKLADEGYGVFFFYRSDCKFCHQMENPIRIFKDSTGIPVLPISVDGVTLDDKFPNSVVDNGQAEKLRVVYTPSIFLVNSKTKDVIPVASGWVSVSEIKERIYILTATEPGEAY